ncbi:hypothetical protein [Acidianus manzaensis]|uniref:Uncharacterized protein n=1 Tax=Acidianus manzaensis TaxID=282676 RepID=A0A1W6JX35_9CREN|nr:hypothetical protein [Acidianus manzaensis]ARM74815.1 hypothetical protein B6F84_01425 [Acidianus manzaensis]
MIDELQVISAIKELYDGKAVSFSKIKKKLKADNEELSSILEKLEKEGKIKRINNGGGKSYELIEDNVEKNDLIIKEIRELKDEIKKLEEFLVEKKKINENSFDEVYEKVKDNLGYAHLEAIRLELGLSKEEFYSKMRKHIEEFYDLIAGGEEGYVRKGSIYGIIKKR